jgi:cysteine synthase A
MPDGDPAQLLLVAHHLVIDGVSWRILLADLAALLEQCDAGHALDLGDASTPFHEWASRLDAWRDRIDWTAALAPWLDTAAGDGGTADDLCRLLGRDAADRTDRVADERVLRIDLDAAATTALVASAGRQVRAPLDRMLLAALVESLAMTSGRRSWWIDVESHGRDLDLDALDLPSQRSRSTPTRHNSIVEAIGRTPLVRLSRVLPDLPFRLYGKIEGLNPGGSAKDRPAALMLRCAMERGQIGPQTTVVESSSGNMAIGLAQACACLGLKLICVIDERTTPQHRKLLAAYGAATELVTVAEAPSGDLLAARIARVKALVEHHVDAFWPNQYGNPVNAQAHHQTAREILEATPVDYLFCATSTCGTLRGCSDYLAATGATSKLIAVDAVGSVIFGDTPKPRLIPGHGASARPALVDGARVDRIVHVSDLECVIGCRRLVKREGILAGGSAGGVLSAIERVRDTIPADAICVAILADCGERYIETIYSDAWVTTHFGDVAHVWSRP